MRFETSATLDAIERRLTTDPTRTAAIADLAEVVRLSGLGGGRTVNLIRLGFIIDALSRYLADNTAALYLVAERGVLSDQDLTSTERMVLRRWSDDGLVELLPAGSLVRPRLSDVATALAQPVLAHQGPPHFTGLVLIPVLRGGVAELTAHGSWPPALGPATTAVAVVRVDGVVRRRFAVSAGQEVIVGRAPEEAGGVELATFLDERTGARISRRHLRVEFIDRTLVATDLSSNGSVLVRAATSAGVGPADRRVPMTPGEPVPLAAADGIELVERVEVGWAGRPAAATVEGTVGSVLGDAPTMMLPVSRVQR